MTWVNTPPKFEEELAEGAEEGEGEGEGAGEEEEIVVQDCRAQRQRCERAWKSSWQTARATWPPAR